MRRTTEAMHNGLAEVILELRRREEWSQSELAMEMEKVSRQHTHRQEAVARWECGTRAPGPRQRAVLAKVADQYGHDDLAELFRAPVAAWRFMVTMQKLKGQSDEHPPRRDTSTRDNRL